MLKSDGAREKKCSHFHTVRTIRTIRKRSLGAVFELNMGNERARRALTKYRMEQGDDRAQGGKGEGVSGPENQSACVAFYMQDGFDSNNSNTREHIPACFVFLFVLKKNKIEKKTSFFLCLSSKAINLVLASYFNEVANSFCLILQLFPQ